MSVKIYNAAGRLKRDLERNTFFAAGKNVIEWDGRDEDRNVCVSGLYIVSLDIMGDILTKTVVIVNKY